MKFYDLEVWKEAHDLTLSIYKYTENFPNHEIFGLRSQIRRAVVSIESCIAEGFNRFHYKDRINFYYDARGSVGEVQSQIMVAKDLKYLDDKTYNILLTKCEKILILLNGLIRKTRDLSKS